MVKLLKYVLKYVQYFEVDQTKGKVFSVLIKCNMSIWYLIIAGLVHFECIRSKRHLELVLLILCHCLFHLLLSSF